MAETLFDMAWRGYTAPMQAQYLRNELDLQKQQIQSNAVNLQNEQNYQRDIQQIWGPGGISAAQDASQNPTDAVLPKLEATAALAAKYSQPGQAAGIMSSIGMLSYRRQQEQKTAQATTQAQLNNVGRILGGVNDQASEDTAIAQLAASGIDPKQLGLTGQWQLDAPKMKQLSEMGLSYQQRTADERLQQAQIDREKHQDMMFQATMARLGQGDARLNMESRRLDLMAAEISDRMSRADRADARAQDNATRKDKMAVDRAVIQAGRMTAEDRHLAESSFATDPRTANLPDDKRKALAGVAMARAKAALAKKVRASGSPDWDAGDLEAEFNSQVDAMAKGGAFKHENSGGGFSNWVSKLLGGGSKDPGLPSTPPPPAAAKAPVKAPLPPVPKGIPAGSTRIGSTPNGKAVWQSPDGKKWVE